MKHKQIAALLCSSMILCGAACDKPQQVSNNSVETQESTVETTESTEIVETAESTETKETEESTVESTETVESSTQVEIAESEAKTEEQKVAEEKKPEEQKPTTENQQAQNPPANNDDRDPSIAQQHPDIYSMSDEEYNEYLKELAKQYGITVPEPDPNITGHEFDNW